MNLEHVGGNGGAIEQLVKSLAFAWDMARAGDDDGESAYKQALGVGDDEDAVDYALRRWQVARRTTELGDMLAAQVDAQAEAAGIDIDDVIALALA